MVLEVAGGGLTLKLAADDWPLVQPTEVHVAVPPVHTAEPVLTPIGMHCLLLELTPSYHLLKSKPHQVKQTV